MTMPQTSRADRRREGRLPSGEDPMLRRPPPSPAGALPPGGGRRRTDADPTAAPGRPPATGERRRAAGGPSAEPQTQVNAPAVQARRVQAPRVQAPPRPAPSVPRPAPSPALSGPLTAAAPAGGRDLPPSTRPDDLLSPPRGATAASPDVAPRTAGMPSWAAEPATPPPLDMTQRVSGAAPAESPWGASAAPAQVEQPRATQAPARPLRSGAPAGARPAPPVVRAVPELAAPEATPEPAPVRNRNEIPVGGRAAARLERQAAEAAAKKSGRRTGPPAKTESRAPSGPARSGPGRDADPDAPPRQLPRRVVQGLVAVVVVAVGVLGFWSFSSPATEETSAQTPVTGAPASTSSAAPVQESVAPAVEVTPPPPVGPVRAPIVVLNSTSITGLAADIGDQFTDGGWEVAGTDASPVEDVATTTVYFTEGDTVQQQAATQLVEQFPDVSGPAVRYFDVPDQPTPGLVVVATGNWRP